MKLRFYNFSQKVEETLRSIELCFSFHDSCLIKNSDELIFHSNLICYESVWKSQFPRGQQVLWAIACTGVAVASSFFAAFTDHSSVSQQKTPPQKNPSRERKNLLGSQQRRVTTDCMCTEWTMWKGFTKPPTYITEMTHILRVGSRIIRKWLILSNKQSDVFSHGRDRP